MLGRPTWVRSWREDDRQQRKADGCQPERQRNASRGQRSRPPPSPRRLRRRVRLLAADHVHVGADPGATNDPVDHGTAGQLGIPGAACGTQDDLGGVERSRGAQQRVARVVADNLLVRSPQLLHEILLPLEQPACALCDAVVRGDVHGHEIAVSACGDASCPPDEAVAVLGPGDRDHDSLARLPRPVDAVPVAVVGKTLFDPVRDPEESELPLSAARLPGRK